MLRNDIIQFINESYTSEVLRIEVDDIGRAWCGDASGNILMSSSYTSLELYATIPGQVIEDLKIVNGVKIAMTSSGIKYEHSHGEFQDMPEIGTLSHAKVITGFAVTNESMYLAGVRGGKVEVLPISITTDTAVENYDYIEGIT